MEAYVNDILPFNEANTQEVIREINMIVRSNAIGIPLLAIIQLLKYKSDQVVGL